MEQIDGRLAVTDVDSNEQRFIKFWIDDFPSTPGEEQPAHHTAEEHAATRDPQHFPLSIPTFPVFSERNAKPRAPRTPDTREGLDTPLDLLVLLIMVVLVLVLVFLQPNARQ